VRYRAARPASRVFRGKQPSRYLPCRQSRSPPVARRTNSLNSASAASRRRWSSSGVRSGASPNLPLGLAYKYPARIADSLTLRHHWYSPLVRMHAVITTATETVHLCSATPDYLFALLWRGGQAQLSPPSGCVEATDPPSAAPLRGRPDPRLLASRLHQLDSRCEATPSDHCSLRATTLQGAHPSRLSKRDYKIPLAWLFSP
jgi:hypothetical protein